MARFIKLFIILALLSSLLAISISGCSNNEQAAPKTKIPKKEDVYQETDPYGKPIEQEADKELIKDPKNVIISSPAFADGQRLPDRFTKSVETGGSNVSPPLQWQKAPQGTKSISLLCVDTAAIAGNWVHWVILNMPPDTIGLPEGVTKNTLPPGSVQLNNSFHSFSYDGPAPPAGSGEHKYEFRVYFLIEKSLDLGTKTSYEEFIDIVKGKAVAIGTLTATYSR